MSKKQIKTLRSRLVYKNPWIQVKEYDIIDRGEEKMYGIVETPPSVYIVAMTPKEERMGSRK